MNYYDGSSHDSLLFKIIHWAAGPLHTFHAATSKNLVVSVVAQLEAANKAPKVLIPTKQFRVPPSILPKRLPGQRKGLRVLDVHPMEIARQLALQQMSLYMRMKSIDILDKTWSE